MGKRETISMLSAEIQVMHKERNYHLMSNLSGLLWELAKGTKYAYDIKQTILAICPEYFEEELENNVVSTKIQIYLNDRWQNVSDISNVNAVVLMDITNAEDAIFYKNWLASMHDKSTGQRRQKKDFVKDIEFKSSIFNGKLHSCFPVLTTDGKKDIIELHFDFKSQHYLE